MLSQTNADDLAQNYELFAAYFDQLHQLTQTDREQIQSNRAELKFREVASKARVIPDESKPVVVLYGKGMEIVNEIRLRQFEKGQARFTRGDLRRLQRFKVQSTVSGSPH
ncbi:hypothetical protein BH20ACI3_BH20ACI3_18280 [soil metagenome]